MCNRESLTYRCVISKHCNPRASVIQIKTWCGQIRTLATEKGVRANIYNALQSQRSDLLQPVPLSSPGDDQLFNKIMHCRRIATRCEATTRGGLFDSDQCGQDGAGLI
jgi:hypothetical protein